MHKSHTVRVDYLARVEGEGGLYLKIRGDRVEEVKLRIFEPPRFFEAFLRGRGFEEAPDITSRICGICPVAYLMSAVHAMEDACGVRVEGALRDLRRLLYCGEWIESHALHIYLLHAPDFLGCDDAIQMAREHRPMLERGLRLKKAGNEVLRLLGGREIHPINVRVGGFYRAPSRAELAPLAEEMRIARDLAWETVRWVSRFEFPDFEPNYEFVALRHPEEYPLNEGRIVSSRGLDIGAREYPDHFVEEQVPHSNALHSFIKGRGAYLVGPLARYSLNFGLLSPPAQQAAQEAGLGPACRNPFRSIVVRAVETFWAAGEALRILESYEPPREPAVRVEPREAEGSWCTEAPRGLLYHHYHLDAAGKIREARIVPPTSQNQKSMEEDLRLVAERHPRLPYGELQRRCEIAVRNHDPCISCATHFLKLDLDRKEAVLVLGVGNSFRGDDAAGIEAARRLRNLAPPSVRVSEREGDLAAVLEDWRDAERVIVIDATSSGSPPGTVVRLDAGEGRLPPAFAGSSTHAIGLAEAMELARALGRLPPIIVYGIEAKTFETGAPLSPEVEAAVGGVVERVLAEAVGESRKSEVGSRKSEESV